MPRLDLLRPYVEKAVGEYLGIEPGKLIVNDDGTIPVTVGSAAYYIRLVDGDPAVLQVYSIMLEEMAKSPELFEALNGINRELYFAKLFWLDDQRIIAATEIVAETADKEEISNACNAIAWTADHYDTELHTKFGGKMYGQDAPTGEGEEAPVDV
jgi:T3SS (YopN, CesT) and YbjN peptide-binding chaperone 1